MSVNFIQHLFIWCTHQVIGKISGSSLLICKAIEEQSGDLGTDTDLKSWDDLVSEYFGAPWPSMRVKNIGGKGWWMKMGERKQGIDFEIVTSILQLNSYWVPHPTNWEGFRSSSHLPFPFYATASPHIKFSSLKLHKSLVPGDPKASNRFLHNLIEHKKPGHLEHKTTKTSGTYSTTN